MKLFERLKSRRTRKSGETGPIVTFTGGMGAQILSAAIYFDLKDRGEKVMADMSYFEQSPCMALRGQAGACSHWGWQLDCFGIPISAFESGKLLPNKSRARRIADGAKKMKLALDALEKPEIQARFEVPQGLGDLLGEGDAVPFLCMHVRRGDYVNVASHLVSDAEFIKSARSFSGLVSRVVILSDSEVPLHFKTDLETHFSQVLVLTGIDAFSSHRVMRGARVLICSNSQFSLIAAMLNQQAMVLLPKQWFSGKEREIEAPIHLRCAFQMMSHQTLHQPASPSGH